MSFLADLHIHSHFSRATSRDCRIVPLAEAAARKGLAVLGTGDLTHAGWRSELAADLVPAEDGLYRLRSAAGPPAEVRFVISGEISCIYKQGGRTRKIHHVLLLPSLAAAERVSAALEARGANLKADGRPIIGLDSRTLLALTLEAEPQAVLIPAHIWTPHFSLFGANSGFDALEECFGDLSSEITAYETGLSSDPPMNWRLSALDRLTLVSNSDAHSPDKLGREAAEFETDLSFAGLAGALRRTRGRVLGTVEFYPEEGKYHYDGHRNCGVCWHPRETLAAGGRCRICGRPVTVGVLHRVDELADRPEGFRPGGAPDYAALIPLREVIMAALDVGAANRRVEETYRRLTEALGPEIPLLRAATLPAIERVAGALVAEAINRMRRGKVEFRPGYDGEYGALTILRPEERRQLAGQVSLFALPQADLEAVRRERASWAAAAGARETAAVVAAEAGAVWSGTDPLAGLDVEQAAAVAARQGPVVVLAGPGTGKTRTLIQRIGRLLAEGIDPSTITAITFTHRAADEMRARLAAAGAEARRVRVGTFHRLCLDLLTALAERPPVVLDEREAAAVLAEAVPHRKKDDQLGARISLLKSRGIHHDSPAVPVDLAEAYRIYQERLAELGACDYDDLLLGTLDLLRQNEKALAEACRRAGHLLVDEFQDVNAVQYHLVRILAGDGANLFAIGDPDQAIYAFRGADHHYFQQLLADFPRSTVCRLRRNYRSTGRIVQAACAFIGTEALATARGAGQRLRCLEAGSPRAEARAVLKEIERLTGGTGMLAADRQSGRLVTRPYSLGEIAILFRTGRQAAPLEEALLAEGIPYRVLGQRALLGAPEVREALDILRFVDRPTDLRYTIALRESRFAPGAAALGQIREFARAGGCSLIDATAELLRTGRFTIAIHERLQAFLDFTTDLRTRAADEAAGDLLLRAAPAGGEPTRTLVQVARAAGQRPLGEFLLRLSTGQEGDHERREDLTRPGEGITLLTMHAAKGLEFPAVFLVGLAEGIMPWRSAEDEEALAEERRLFFVSLTRAAEMLILVGPPEGGDRGPSRFLRELPPEAIEKAGASARRKNLAQQGLF